MHGNRSIFDEVDEIFEAFFGRGNGVASKNQNRRGEYPIGRTYVYSCPTFPPADITINRKNSNIFFEMALAGIPKENIDVSFKNDYMILEIKNRVKNQEEVEYLHKGIKKDVEISSKYYVPETVYDTGKAKASFVDGILKIEIPAKPEVQEKEKKLLIK